jgi:hypothetical protein
MLPLVAAQLALGGAQALSGLFGKKHNFRNPNISPFAFTPDPNDPEIALRRRAALLDIQRGHSDTINEIGRAGLLGSSAAFGLLNQNQTQGEAGLEDIPNSVYARQRQDALALYRDNANFQRSLALADQSGYQQEHMAGLDALGELGTNIGYGNPLATYSSSNDWLHKMKKRYLTDQELGME